MTGLAIVMTLGAGCTASTALSNVPFLAKDVTATEVDLQTGSNIALRANSINPLEDLKARPERVLKLTDWAPSERVAFDWSETFERETAASITARTEAERSTGVGETPNVPEPVMETITLSGSLSTNALDDGSRIFLPSSWPEQTFSLNDGPNTIIWLSKQQYDELVETRHTNLSLGLIDAGLATAERAFDAIKNLVAQVQGEEPAPAPGDNVTELVAEAEWGSYTFKVDDERVTVPVIIAENGFAKYKILANPDNPMILQVDLKSWAVGLGAVGIVTSAMPVEGYEIVSITTSSTFGAAQD